MNFERKARLSTIAAFLFGLAGLAQLIYNITTHTHSSTPVFFLACAAVWAGVASKYSAKAKNQQQ